MYIGAYRSVLNRMATAVNDIIEYVLFGRFNNQVEVRNVFHYQISSMGQVTGTDAFTQLYDAGKSFWDAIKTAYRPVIVVPQIMYQVSAKWVRGDGVGIQNVYQIPTAEQAGTASGESMPPFVTLTILYQGSGGQRRNGYKRIGVVGESLFANGIANIATGQPSKTLADAFAADIAVKDEGTGLITRFGTQPVIVKKQANGLNPTQYDVLDAWRPVGVRPLAAAGSQSTRKLSRGI